MNKYIRVLINMVLLCAIASCTSNFDKYNLDPDRPLEEELEKDNLWAALLMSMQRNVISADANNFQLSEDLFGNVYAGYFASTNNWEGGRNSTTYVYPAHWINTPFTLAYVNFLSLWDKLRKKVEPTSIIYATAQVIKVHGMHKITDMYGPIPYSKFGFQDPVPYDSQEEVYKQFFKELEHSIDVMVKFNENAPGSSALKDFDLIYGGDINIWIKYANSLRLRLAMRIRFADPALAKLESEKSLNHPYGVIGVNDDIVQLREHSATGFVYRNPIKFLWDDYNDQCMGATMDSYLNGLNDPRLSKYFTPISGGTTFRGIRNGHKDGAKFKEKKIAKPNIIRETPYFWMTPAEVCFLRAEGAILGWDMKDNAENLYNMGIRLSCEVNKVDANLINDYITNDSNKPSNYSQYEGSPSHPAMSTITVKWNDAATEEVKLERIITQKWIATFPLGQEAWSEYRRTGYPKIFPIVDNMSNGKVNSDIQVRRIPFPEAEYNGNRDEINKAIGLLQGEDTGGTKLWWDAK